MNLEQEANAAMWRIGWAVFLMLVLTEITRRFGYEAGWLTLGFYFYIDYGYRTDAGTKGKDGEK